MASFNKFQSTVEGLAHAKFKLDTDQLEVALVNATNGVDAANDSVLADITPIAYTNLSARTITTNSSGQTGGTYTLSLNDLTLTASGGAANPFRYVVVFDQTATNDDLIGYFDYGSDLTLQDTESLEIDFGANGSGAGGLFTLV